MLLNFCFYKLSIPRILHLMIFLFTLSLKSLSPLSSVCFKTTQTTGSVGVAGDCPPTSKLRTFL